MPLLKLFHKSLEPIWQFGRKKVFVLAPQGMSQDEGHLFLREAEAVESPICPIMIIALLHGDCSLPCIALVSIC